ncbi:hypothetical protein [Pseudomonas brassicacearum]|uniref:hypothetical protein n=1 Tax=Pseudomonas brassicacearum TaxID=930166 RepID=UPI00025FE506|nr:hypothetical protein PflQ8_2157 [Pseudomonas fluorescens Q8r1-96]
MSLPVFEQVTAGLYRLSTLAESGLESYWAGYLASPGSDLGASASLAQTWADQGGAYLFCASAPADPATFVADLRTLWPRLSPKGWLRLLWIANPTDSASQWQTQGIDALPVGEPSGGWRVVRDMRFALGQYAVAIKGGNALVAGSDSLLFDGAGLSFFAQGGVYAATQPQCPLPLSGTQLGCLTFGIRAGNGLDKEADDMQRLGVMLRYGEADTDSPVGEVNLIDMPLFRQLDTTPFDLALTFDPLNPERPQRSALVFATGQGSVPTFGFAQLSNTGHATLATPRAGSGDLPGARLSFGRTPLFDAADVASANLVWHLAPDGLFDLGTPQQARSSDGNTRLILGVSGTETVVLPQVSASLLLFQANGAAYLPPASEEANGAALSNLGTTAWATVLSDGGSGRSYEAQPPRSPLFNAASVPVAGFLSYLNMNAATLPTLQASQQSAPVGWPMGVYGRIAPGAIDQAAHLEDAALAPTRRKLIGLPPLEATRSAPTGRLRLGMQADAADADTRPLGVTPSGLIAVLNPAQSAWAGVLFANMPQSDTGQLIFTEVKPPFQAALQSNQLFMVVADVDTFMSQGSSVAYQLTATNAVSRLLAAGVPVAQAQAINNALKALDYPEFPNETTFDAAVSSSAGDYLAEAQAAAGLLRADIEGWTFQLSPRSWRNGTLTPTLMLFKYCGRAITELAADTGAWCWPQVAQAADGSLAPTQAALNAVISKARLAALDPDIGDSDPLVLFYHEVLHNPRWNGVLFLNAPIDFQDMPSALRFMAAGVDRSRFYAHHIGFSLTPYTPHDGIIDLGQTAAFGLIDYNDPDDLVASTTIPFGYKTLSMRVRFDNARVVDFSAEAELMVNRLFASWLAKVDRARGNNLILTGSYQRIGGQPSYSFSLLGNNVFQSNGAALASIDIRDCRLETAAAPVDGLLTANFVLSGRLAFVEIPEFDLFGYGPGEAVNGYLGFQGLVVAMSFAMENPSQQRFTSGEAGVGFNTGPGASLARPASLVENFPLRLDGLVAAPDLAPTGQQPQGATPESLGFTSIGAPLDQQPLAAPWFGLSLALDMGTLGALSGAIGLKITLLAAWGPEPVAGDPPVYLGIKLGMSNAISGSLPLQGVLKLGFRNFLFETWRDSDHRLNYLLRMRRFALSVLAWSFPPGNADLMLFGAPGSPKTSLGWYAAYLKDEDKKKQQALLAGPAPRQIARRTPDSRRLARSGRRTPPVI